MFCFSTHKVSVALFVLVVVFSPVAVVADQCPGPKHTAYSDGNMFESFKYSVFKVWARENEQPTAIGTATLFDKRGYFVTASHITELQHDYKAPAPYQQPLTLTNEHSGITLVGKEIIHIPYEKLDVSIIKAEFPEPEMLKNIPAVDIKANETSPGVNLATLGYELAKKNVYYHGFIGLSGHEGENQFVMLNGTVFPGESGSVAIDAKGKAVGILHKRGLAEGKPNKIYFTHLHRARKVFEEIPPNPDVVAFLNLLTKKDVSESRIKLHVNREVSHYEALIIRKLLATDAETYTPGLRRHARLFFEMFVCNELLDDAFWFTREYASLIELPTYALVDSAQYGLNKYLKGGAPDTELLKAAVNLFAKAETRVNEGAGSKYYKSNFYYDYALALNAKVGLKDKAGRAQVAEKLAVAMQYNNANWKSYTLANEVLAAANDNENAKLAIAVADAQLFRLQSIGAIPGKAGNINVEGGNKLSNDNQKFKAARGRIMNEIFHSK